LELLALTQLPFLVDLAWHANAVLIKYATFPDTQALSPLLLTRIPLSAFSQRQMLFPEYNIDFSRDQN
jgi:hypothetical protein